MTNKITWNITDDYLIGKTNDFKYNKKIASFDLDGTIIKVKSGKRFPNDKDDWIFIYDINMIHKKIFDIQKNYCVIIISNQGGIKDNKQKQNDWIEKVNNIYKELININNIELLVFASIKTNKFRKPMTGFFECIFDKNIKISNKSFYCGDACGRLNDHSDCDYKFACNMSFIFYTPQCFFLNETNETINEIEYVEINNNNHFDYENFIFEPKNKDVVIMVGCPASGKSYISSLIKDKYNYNIINQDKLITINKCLKEFEIMLKNNKNIIVDNTNPSIDTRNKYIKLCNEYDYNVRIIYIDIDKDLAIHRNYYRLLKSNIYIPNIAYNIYYKKFEHPKLTEQVNEIIILKPNLINDSEYYKYLY
jgi:bifunctional polynucleotide phosphatase/kinase